MIAVVLLHYSLRISYSAAAGVLLLLSLMLLHADLWVIVLTFFPAHIRTYVILVVAIAYRIDQYQHSSQIVTSYIY